MSATLAPPAATAAPLTPSTDVTPSEVLISKFDLRALFEQTCHDLELFLQMIHRTPSIEDLNDARVLVLRVIKCGIKTLAEEFGCSAEDRNCAKQIRLAGIGMLSTATRYFECHGSKFLREEDLSGLDQYRKRVLSANDLNISSPSDLRAMFGINDLSRSAN